MQSDVVLGNVPVADRPWRTLAKRRGLGYHWSVKRNHEGNRGCRVVLPPTGSKINVTT